LYNTSNSLWGRNNPQIKPQQGYFLRRSLKVFSGWRWRQEDRRGKCQYTQGLCCFHEGPVVRLQDGEREVKGVVIKKHRWAPNQRSKD
jgi:hypothetical protein